MINSRGGSRRERPRPLPVLAAILAGLALCLSSCISGVDAQRAVVTTPAVSGPTTTATGNPCASPSTRYDQACHTVTTDEDLLRCPCRRPELSLDPIAAHRRSTHRNHRRRRTWKSQDSGMSLSPTRFCACPCSSWPPHTLVGSSAADRTILPRLSASDIGWRRYRR
jgi:hypothetical protein